MSEDSSIKAVDKQKLKSYIRKWRNFKYLLGSALFHDLLKPLAIMCKVLQEDELCIVRVIESVLKTKRSMDKLKEMPFEDLPTVKKVLEWIQREDGSISYQAAELTLYDIDLEFIKSHHVEWMESIEACLLQRLKTCAPELEILTQAITILATIICPWSFGECLSTISYAGTDISLVKEEWGDMLEYSKQYLLFNSVDAKKWSNVLAVIRVAFLLANSQWQSGESLLTIETDKEQSTHLPS